MVHVFCHQYCMLYAVLYLQGITIKPLVNALKVKKKQGGSSTMGEQIHVRVRSATLWYISWWCVAVCVCSSTCNSMCM